ncbi:hypothetical protein, partial [Paenibacillus sp. 598K]|uniref:hypothetical protein n=1 Tax=Paenibacillus sp. 598K TaxID=1117987 RepID=UPI001C87D106
NAKVQLFSGNGTLGGNLDPNKCTFAFIYLFLVRFSEYKRTFAFISIRPEGLLLGLKREMESVKLGSNLLV